MYLSEFDDGLKTDNVQSVCLIRDINRFGHWTFFHLFIDFRKKTKITYSVGRQRTEEHNGFCAFC